MEENCNHECEGCHDENCASRKPIEKLKPHQLSSFGKTIAIVSGKGGVGKSLVTSLLAATLEKRGNKVAILDADVTGPSIPKAFGITDKATGDDNGIFAAHSSLGAAIMSTNMLLEHDADPVIWRGPMIANMVTQLYTNVIYGEAQYLLIDMPPGTGDVPLTVFQSIKIDAIVIVGSPQELVSIIVEKAVNMAKMMNVKILGLVENMAYATCPDCGKKIHIFGNGDLAKTAEEYGIPLLDEMPIDPSLAAAVDKGEIESFDKDYLKGTADAAEKI